MTTPTPPPDPSSRPSLACRAARPLRHVVVGTGLDSNSDEALRAAWELTRRAGAELYIVHAADPAPMGVALGSDWLSPQALELALARQKTRLGDQLERLGIEPGKLGGWHVEMGPPHKVLLRAAQQVSADLIVVGATRTSRLGRLLGSTADRVTRRAVCPVLVVREGLEIPPRRVLAPVDLSELSADGLVCGLALVERIGGDDAAATEVDALYVQDFHGEPWAEDLTTAELEKIARHCLEDLLLEHGSQVAGELRPVLRIGEPREEILRHLEEHPADLVVLSTHGRGGFERLLLGSVAAETVRRSPVSVLLVPPEAALGTALAEAVTAQTVPV